MAHLRIFLSAVTDEFRSYRDRLAAVLKRPNVSVHVQEDFVAHGGETLEKLDDYIRQSDAVIHLVGDMTGAMASRSGASAILRRYPDLPARVPVLAGNLLPEASPLSFTQWEALLALYHGKVLLIAVPAVGAPRDPSYRLDTAVANLQREHLARLEACHRYPAPAFANVDDLAIQVLRSNLHDMLRKVEVSTAAGLAGVMNEVAASIRLRVNDRANTVTLYADGFELTLSRLDRLKMAAETERDLLLPELRAINLVGRDEDLCALQTWLVSPRPISVRCVTGRAGSGKTRLAIELCEWATQRGWIAGFLRNDTLLKFHETGGPKGWLWGQPVLVVIDYAGSSAAALRDWLTELAQFRQSETPPLRLLLLERHASSGSGWWDQVFGAGGIGRSAEDLLDPPQAVALAPLRVIADRRALLAQVMQEAARLRGLSPAPQPPAAGTNPEYDERLGQDSLDHEPLFLAMAGIVSVSTGAPTALALNRLDLATRIARDAQRRLEYVAHSAGIEARLITHLVACVTLQSGCDRKSTAVLLDQEHAALGYPATGALERIADLLREALPAAGGGDIDAIRPDLIGEAFLLRELGRDGRSAERQAEIVARAYARSPDDVVRTVLSTAQDYCDGKADHISLLWLDRLKGSISQNLGALIKAVNVLPAHTVGLRERAADWQAAAVVALRTAAASDPNLIPLLATGLNNLAARTSELGELELGVVAAAEALALRRELAVQRPVAFGPDLADSLNTYAHRLNDLGRHEEALAAAKEAVAVSRELAAQSPDALRPRLARSLNTFANVLSDLGHRENAHVTASEATGLYRELAMLQPARFRPGLAVSLYNLSNRLSDLDRSEDALAAAVEAVTICRELATQRPDAFGPDLASSLTALANSLADLDRHAEALMASQEVATIWRELATERPDAFHPDLARALVNVANSLFRMGRREDALITAKEAAALYRQLTTQRREAYLPDLAKSLQNLGVMFADLGRHKDAVAAGQEATAIYRELAAARPDSFDPILARSLEATAHILGLARRDEDSLPPISEAATLYRQLAGREDAYRRDLATSLNKQAVTLIKLGRSDASLLVSEQAAAIYSELAQHDDVFRLRWTPIVRQPEPSSKV